MSLRMSLQLIGLDVMEKQLKRVEKIFPAAVVLAKKATILIEKRARELAPIGKTRRLRFSIIHKFIKESKNEFIGEVGTNVKYAPSVEFGSRAHVISGRSASGLIFFKEGKFIRKQFVIHPGAPAQPFLTKAFGEITPRLRKRIQELINKAVK